ncbi:MAG: glycosyltransferase [Candidatus Nitrosocaldaceae archaeon]
MSIDFIVNAYEQYLSLYHIYIPLSIIGIWRWSWWIIKKIRGMRYKPYTEEYTSNVSVVIPVYKENPSIFRETLNSVLSNNPYEVICVIDEEDKENIKYVKSITKNEEGNSLLSLNTHISFITTNEKGKRSALARGIRIAKGDIVALIDSDVIWAENTLKNGIKPFKDPSIAGVCTRQNACNRNNVWATITDMFWDARNHDDLPALAVGKAMSCLSGRTAFWRRDFLQNNLDEFLNERIFGVKKESGEDKCLTRLAQRESYNVYFQNNAQIYSYAVTDFKTFITQRIRWSRNTFNSDLKSMKEGWVFKKPFLLFIMLDRFISIFTILLSPTIFILAVLYNHLTLAYIILGLWFIGRSIKHARHLYHHPGDIIMIPLYLFISYIIAFIKLYSLITITEQKSIRGTNKTKLWKHILGIASAISVLLAYILFLLILRGIV